ncbi:MAG: hypothetical protein ACI4RO_00495, partial [Candidatus Scatosoma sp.]
EKFRAITQYMRAVLNNRLGMNDFSEANRAMRLLNDCYNALDDSEREVYEEDYTRLYRQYDEFYEAESENRRNREITYSDGYADKNDVSLANFAEAIARGAARWASSSSCATETVYTINGIRYTRGEFGYLYDESGMKSDYRIDDYSRLYNANETELGYFNKDGLFIES